MHGDGPSPRHAITALQRNGGKRRIVNNGHRKGSPSHVERIQDLFKLAANLDWVILDWTAIRPDSAQLAVRTERLHDICVAP